METRGFFRDGELIGTFLGIEHGIPIGFTIANAPWHWIRALSMYQTVKTIYQNASYDPEGQIAPKIYWFDNQALQRWY